jgi:hypothetical protein
MLLTPTSSPAFWWTLTAFIALLAMQAVYWIVTHPVNKYWLKDTRLQGFGGEFFSLDPLRKGAASERGSEDWRRLHLRLSESRNTSLSRSVNSIEPVSPEQP